MPQYVIEYHLLATGERQHPMTRVAVVEALDIGEAAGNCYRDLSPGPDCVKVTITEVTEQD